MARDKQLREVQRLGVMPTGLVEYSTATISDAMQKVGVQDRILEPAIRPLLPFMKMVGIAVTVKVIRSDTPGNYAPLMGRALESGREVACPVLVIEQPQDLVGATVLGSGGAHTMRNHYGFVGCLSDGFIRDTDDLKKMNFQAYSRGVHPEYRFGLMKGVSVNEPVVVGGVRISPGDIIVGDHDGVAAIDPRQLDRFLEAANQILEQERSILNEIDAGDPFLKILRRHQPEAFQGEQ